ncbi:hypothetical protein ACWDTT_30645 [Streptosporangium sandarakinum]|uniref:hypothetical protein n=1 Tax=Streptosporangium TaxID=2000 RepID=UPI0031F8C6A2
MRSRLPAVLLLLLSAFVLLPPPGDAHRPADAAPVAWWSGPALHAAADPAVHAGADPVLPRLHPARGTPAPPAWPAVLPPVWEPGGTLRPAGIAAGPAPAAPLPRPRRAPARAPPSTTR